MTRATVGNKGSVPLAMVLLVDIGASFTVIRPGTLKAIGCDISVTAPQVTLVSGQGIISAPLIEVPWFNCLGQLVKPFSAVAYTLPAGAKVDGLLGMDFLTRFRALINVAESEILFG